MRIVMIYRDDSYQSKSQAMPVAKVKEIADKIYDNINKIDKLQFETDDGIAIFPKAILKETIAYVVIEDCDRSHPDNPQEETDTV